MEKINFECSYCNVGVEYLGEKDSLVQEIWNAEHEGCKDFLYVYKVNVRKKKEVEYESNSN